MALPLLVVGLAAVVAVAEPALEQYPHMAAPALVCSRPPYSQYLPLSQLPAAQEFCKTRFPLVTPKCSSTVTVTKTKGSTTITATITNVAGIVTTITTGRASTVNTTLTVQPAPVISTSTVKVTESVYVCTQPSGPYTNTTTTTATPPSTTPQGDFTTTTTTPASSNTGLTTSVSDGLSKRAVAPTTTKAPDLAPGVRASLRSRLSTVKSMAGAPKLRPTASTICRCIQTNPPCTTSVSTRTTFVPSTFYTTRTKHTTVTYTNKLPNNRTMTSTKIVTRGDPVVINHITSITTTLTAMSCNGTGAGTGTGVVANTGNVVMSTDASVATTSA